MQISFYVQAIGSSCTAIPFFYQNFLSLALVDMIYAGVLNRDYAHLSGKLRKTSDIVMERAYTSKEEMEAFTKI